MTRATVVTQSLGGSPLSRAAQNGALAPQWYRPVPRDAEAWRSYARDVTASVDANWLTALRPALTPSGAAAARLDRVAQSRGIVITTGQQPGLFGGPLMTYAKALTARAIADVLEAEFQIPAAPVFWAATDDADLAEAARISVAADGGAVELRLMNVGELGRPMSNVAMTDEIAELAKQLCVACG